MYVQYMVPRAATGAPVIMVHGGTHTGKTYETTPDGREGWATYFARRGHPVYVVDMPGRGRSGWDRSFVNQAVIERDPSVLPQGGIGFNSNDTAWKAFRIGPRLGEAFPGTRFPVEAFEQYTSQLNPRGEVFLDTSDDLPTQALVTLLDTIGPAVLMVHSQSGDWGLAATFARPDKVRALIGIEPAATRKFVIDDPAFPARLAATPMLYVFGDHVDEVPVWRERMDDCAVMLEKIERTRLIHLPSIGMPGNSHMIMMDNNNLEVADLILRWLEEAVSTK
jgi:pimeloyl-ACP methyl ester carboxylesterase